MKFKNTAPYMRTVLLTLELCVGDGKAFGSGQRLGEIYHGKCASTSRFIFMLRIL